MPLQSLNVTPLGPFIGAEISGVDLAGSLDDATVCEIRDALFEYLAIFFRNQQLTPQTQIALAERLGEPLGLPLFPSLSADYPNLSLLDTGGPQDPATPGTKFAHWHTDVPFFSEPPLAAILHAKTIPEAGGDTVWASMIAAYEALSAEMKEFLSGLTAVHDMGDAYRRAIAQRGGEEKLSWTRENYPPAEHPIVRTHPVTGRRSLYVNEAFTTRIKELGASESDAVLQMLFAHQRIPEFQVRFEWSVNAVAMWDEPSTIHYALADYGAEKRVMHRIMIKGSRPFYRAAAE